MAPHNTYSRIVAWTKVILPLVALGLLSTLFLFANAPDPERAIPFAEVNVEELAREQRLGRPRVAGTLSDGREVIFIAEQAVPLPGPPQRFEALDVEARIDLSPDQVLIVVSDTGLFSPTADTAELTGSVGLTTSSGYNLTTELLQIDLGGSSATSPGAVEVTGPGLTIHAGGMMVTSTQGHDQVHFTNGVRVLYEPRS